MLIKGISAKYTRVNICLHPCEFHKDVNRSHKDVKKTHKNVRKNLHPCEKWAISSLKQHFLNKKMNFLIKIRHVQTQILTQKFRIQK